jgi:hypothetical protein
MKPCDDDDFVACDEAVQCFRRPGMHVEPGVGRSLRPLFGRPMTRPEGGSDQADRPQPNSHEPFVLSSGAHADSMNPVQDYARRSPAAWAQRLVINRDGSIAGFQDKVQIDPSEDDVYSGSGRRVFQTGPLVFGVAICHEGWRYPETVRWAAHDLGGGAAGRDAGQLSTIRGARIVDRGYRHHCGHWSISRALQGCLTSTARSLTACEGE